MAANDQNDPTQALPEQQQQQSLTHNHPSLPSSPTHPTKKAKTDEASLNLDSTLAPDAQFLDTSKPLPDPPALQEPLDPYIQHTSNLLSQDTMLITSIPLQVKLLKPGAKPPTRGSKFSAGYDVYVCEAGVVPARGKAMLSTGISIACPPNTYARIAPRSGLAAKHSLQTGTGVIDYDYRGEVKVLLFNHSDEDFKVEAGDRMAQMIFERIATPDVIIMDELPDTERGDGGFGSTGGFSAPLMPPLPGIDDLVEGVNPPA